ncbi:MAG: diaminopimelate decarboxylase [Acidobacteriota bacterium]
MKTVDGSVIQRLAREYGTPVYVYDAGVIRQRIRALRRFDLIRFAQKANSNIHMLRLMRSEGVLVDATSAGELRRALAAGYSGNGDPAAVVYTADVLSDEVLELVVKHGIPVNAGSTDMLGQLGRRHPSHRVWLRINPGFGHGHSRKTNTGGEWSKHGIWHEYAHRALQCIEEYQLRLVGLHMHIGSGSDFDHLKGVCEAMVNQVAALKVDIASISGGGGLPIPYRDDESPFDTDGFFRLWHQARGRIEEIVGHGVSLEIEPGRYLVGEAGLLIAEVRATKLVGANRFVLVDAGFDNLLRPALYGSHHAISAVKRNGEAATGPAQATVVGGPLCEAGDLFTQDDSGLVVPVDLPAVKVGDYLVFHDAGAYASAMASNYNSRPLAPEVLIDGGEPRLIRRRQTIDDLLELEAFDG